MDLPWFAFGIDRTKSQLVLLGFAHTEPELRAKLPERVAATMYETEVFRLDYEAGKKLYDWLTGRGFSRQDARNAVKDVIAMFKEIMESNTKSRKRRTKKKYGIESEN